MTQLDRTLCLKLAVSILWLMTSVPLATAKPRPEKANWDNVKQLLPGEKIRIKLNNAKSCEGLLQSVTDDGMVVRLATGEQTFTRQNIVRVSQKGQSNRGRNAGLGALIGAGSGAAVGGAIAGPPGALLGALFLGMPPGALVGAVIPTGGWRDVYRAPKNGEQQFGKVRSNGALSAAGK